MYRVLHSTHMFGSYLRTLREASGLSLRKLAETVDVEPSYISKVERDLVAPPGEHTIKRIANVLGQDPDVLLAVAGKISSDLRQAIIKRPELFSRLIRAGMRRLMTWSFGYWKRYMMESVIEFFGR